MFAAAPFCWLLVWLGPASEGAKEEQSVTKRAEQLGKALQSIFEQATKHSEIGQAFANIADADHFSPEAELKELKNEMETFLKQRTALAWNAKLSLEQRRLGVGEDGNETRPPELNNPQSKNFVRYLNVKKMSNGALIYLDGHFGGAIEVNGTEEIQLRPNPNFYGVPTSSDSSAIHVPTPIYNRDPELLYRIQWSDIDQQYRRNREQLKDLGFQKFCSESGFMRFFPSAPWLWEDRQAELDIFDCRNSEWYVESATMPRNVLILLDSSGSMLGQRFEIARQTIETILGGLSDSDFLNIIQFSKTAHLVEECGGRELVQATLRNKKWLLSRLTNISSEGKADYEHALHKAFVVLMNIKKSAGQRQRVGCQDIIVLVTDGAPGFYREIFDLYNKDKRVRFFSFIVGEEAKDFKEVRWMACSNRGTLAHVVSMADVHEKVQQYVRVLSSTVARQSAAFSEGTPVWSGPTRERMADQQSAVSVSFPVVLPEGQFMGVSSVSVPLSELAQLAHQIRVGGRSHWILLDANGYVLMHPQLRTHERSGELRAGSNSVEFTDAEVQRPYTARTLSIDCQAGSIEPSERETMFALDELRRVYPQLNHYHALCIPGTPFTLVLAVPDGDTKRLKRAQPAGPSEAQPNWLRGGDWRLHPGWRYCLLNDSDFALGAEGAMREYVRQMRAHGKWPELCKSRRPLVERTLLDLQATAGFGQLWERELERNRKNGVHLAFFVSPSGLIRYRNQSLHDRLFYERPANGGGNESSSSQIHSSSYKHFLLELHPDAAESDFFRRAVRQSSGRITFDLNRKTRLWQGKGRKTGYGHAENETLLALAYKSVYVDGALAGVAGVEFLYDSLVSQMRHIGCQPDGDRNRCYLLDEHGYVLYTSNRHTRYAEFTHLNIESAQASAAAAAHNWHSGRRRKGGQRAYFQRTAAHQQSHGGQAQQQQQAGSAQPQEQQQLELGRFFGQLNRVTEWTMELLVRRGFYKQMHFTDAQAVCEPPAAPEPVPAATASAGGRMHLTLGSALLALVLRLGSLLSALLLPPGLSSALQLSTYASLLKVQDGRFPCRLHSAFYLGNMDARTDGPDGALLESGDSYERPCRQNAAQCAVRVFASWVPGTNLLLLMIRQDSRSQCFPDSASHCPLSQPPAVPFGILPTPPPPSDLAEQQAAQQDQCHISRPQQREQQQGQQCLRDDFLEDEAEEEGCSGAKALVPGGMWTPLPGTLFAICAAIVLL